MADKALQLRFGTSSNTSYEEKSGTPPWLGGNLTNAWGFSNPNTDYAYSIQGNTAYIQYGQRDPSVWASNRFWAETVEILNEQKLDDGSVKARVKVTPLFWQSIRVSSLAGYPVTYDIRINNKTIWSYSGNTIDTISKGQGAIQEFEITVPPKGTSDATAFHVFVNYPQGQYPNNNFKIGFFVYNDNEKEEDIKPWAIRKSGVFKTHNRPSGWFKIRKSGSWADKSKQKKSDVKQPNKGVHRIRKGGTWLGQNKIGEM